MDSASPCPCLPLKSRPSSSSCSLQSSPSFCSSVLHVHTQFRALQLLFLILGGSSARWQAVFHHSGLTQMSLKTLTSHLKLPSTRSVLHLVRPPCLRLRLGCSLITVCLFAPELPTRRRQGPCLLCSWLCPQHPERYQAHSRCSITIYRMDTQMRACSI